MKVKDIRYPTPLSDIADIENDNIDVFVELEDGHTYTLVVGTPNNLCWYMDKEEKKYVPAGIPWIIVRALTEENIRRAMEEYAAGDAYWLKYYYLATDIEISEMNRMINELHDVINQGDGIDE